MTFDTLGIGPQSAANAIVCPSCGRNNVRRATTCAGCRTCLRAAAASADFNVKGVLQGSSIRQCPSCGCSSQAGARICPNCRAALPMAREDENAAESLNMVHGDQRQSPLAWAGAESDRKRNIDKLQEAYEGLANGTLTADDYTRRVTAVYRFMETAVQLSRGEVAQRRIEQMDSPLKELSQQAVVQIEAYLAAIGRMRDYSKTKDLREAEAGLRSAQAVADKIIDIKAEVDVIAAQEA